MSSRNSRLIRNGRPGERDLDLALGADVLDTIPEKMGDMRGIGGCGDGDNGLGLRNPPGRREYRGAAEAVPDQDRRRFPGLAQMIGGAHQIGDVGGEGRIGEIALAGTEPVKSNRSTAMPLCRVPSRSAAPPARPCRR